MKTERLSNMELQRIVAMMSVVLVHLDGAVLGLPTPQQAAAGLPRDVWRIVVEALTITGVNCFTLISGWFGIRATRRGFLRLVGMCLFYSVGICLLSFLLKPDSFSWTALADSLRIFTRNDLWYVPAYLLLYVLSPMLNAACQTLDNRRLTIWTSAFVVLNIWGGWANGMAFNPTGYTPVQLIMVYLIGRTLRRIYPTWLGRHTQSSIASQISQSSQKSQTTQTSIASAAFVLLTAATAWAGFKMPSASAFAYNSPWVLAQSAALFMVFASLNFSSKIINSFAKGAFAAYLIHKNPFIWNEFIRPVSLKMWRHHGLMFYTGFILAFASAIYVLSTVIELARFYITRKLFSNVFTNKN